MSVSPNELRIGNWVEHNGTSWSYREKGLKSFLGHPYRFQWEDSDWYALGECTLSLDDIDAIPLTPDIMKACGFYVSGCIFDYKLKLFLDHSQDFGEFSFKWGSYDSTRILYLHQLQNLVYDMMGEELIFGLVIQKAKDAEL